MNLREWMILHVKHKDAFTKSLREVKEEKDSVVFVFKDHALRGFSMERLDVPDVKDKTLIVTLQKKENVETLIRKWEEFSKHPHLTIIFCNPGRNEKWSIKPHFHARVSEGAVEQGIWSMAEGVTFL